MKKLLLIVTVVAVLTIGASAAFAQNEEGSNMDYDTYLSTRTAQLDEALLAEDIDQDQYDALLAHITESANNGDYGFGGYENRDQDDCIFGEEGSLGIFRNAGGLGNGTNNGGQAKGLGNGSATGSHGESRGSNGMRLQDGSADNADCIIN